MAIRKLDSAKPNISRNSQTIQYLRNAEILKPYVESFVGKRTLPQMYNPHHDDINVIVLKKDWKSNLNKLQSFEHNKCKKWFVDSK